jgi:hypothetical protein
VKAKPSLPPRLEELIQDVTLAAGRLTERWRTLPNLLVAGGQRCGTTSMYRALTQHPAVLKAVLHKGVHYFDTNYDKGMSWYRAHFPLEATVRRVAGRTSTIPVILESSPYYGFHPLAGERIAKDLPDVRLLVLLRDPVERAYSAHAHELARGYETEPFERALELEQSRLAGEEERLIADPSYVSHCHQHNGYLTRGHYVELLQRLESCVGRDRIHVVDSHRFFESPHEVYDGVLEFLRLPRAGYPVFDQHNARPRSPMSPALRERLDAHFLPWDEQLADWLGWTPSWRA